MSPYIMRMTISTRSSNSEAKTAFGIDLHFKGVFRGNIRHNRRFFARRGVRYFQRFIYKRTGIWIPTYKLRIRFESEQATTRATKTAHVVGQSMNFKNHEVRAINLGVGRMRITKEKKKHATKKGKKSKKRSK